MTPAGAATPVISARQSGDARQLASLEPFEKRSAGSRDISKVARHPCRIQGRDRVAATRNGRELARLRQSRRGARQCERALTERCDLKRTHRPVPEKRL